MCCLKYIWSSLSLLTLPDDDSWKLKAFEFQCEFQLFINQQKPHSWNIICILERMINNLIVIKCLLFYIRHTHTNI